MTTLLIKLPKTVLIRGQKPEAFFPLYKFKLYAAVIIYGGIIDLCACEAGVCDEQIISSI